MARHPSNPSRRTVILSVAGMVIATAALLLVGIWAAELRHPSGPAEVRGTVLDQHQPLIYSVFVIASVIWFFASRFLFQWFFSGYEVGVFPKLMHAGTLLVLLSGFALGLFLIVTDTFEGWFCFLSYPATILVAFSWLALISIIHRPDTFRSLSPLTVIALGLGFHVLNCIAIGIIIHDVHVMHRWDLLQVPNQSFATHLFYPMVWLVQSQDVHRITANTVFAWLVVIIALLTVWAYRFVVVAGLTWLIAERFKSE